jgi:hypothetical protein
MAEVGSATVPIVIHKIILLNLSLDHKKKAGTVASLPFLGKVLLGLGNSEMRPSSVPSSNNHVSFKTYNTCKFLPNLKPLIPVLPVSRAAPFQPSMQILIGLYRSIQLVLSESKFPLLFSSCTCFRRLVLFEETTCSREFSI